MKVKNYIQKNLSASYFIAAFVMSWLGAFILVAHKIFNKEPFTKIDGILMFPVMLIGPCSASIILTAVIEGGPGLHNLRSRLCKWKLPIRWYVIALTIPPCSIVVTLLILKNFVSPVFTPNFFPLGFLFGIPAGFLEEIGWTGYAFPKLFQQRGFLKASILVGLLWGLWHLPVIDFLGAATPHGKYLIPFFLAFIGILSAMRVIISWAYANTNSILLAQLMHIVSTGSLVMLGPSKAIPEEEALWYASYAALLWIVVFFIYRLAIRKQTSR